MNYSLVFWCKGTTFLANHNNISSFSSSFVATTGPKCDNPYKSPFPFVAKRYQAGSRHSGVPLLSMMVNLLYIDKKRNEILCFVPDFSYLCSIIV